MDSLDYNAQVAIERVLLELANCQEGNDNLKDILKKTEQYLIKQFTKKFE